jgi:drug/metabolite transporter (DMT)-like permease
LNPITWLPVAIASYLLLSINGSVDRAIVHQEKTKPIVISFWVAIFSVATAGLVIIGFLPVPFADAFSFEFASAGITALAILAGTMTQAGLLFMYRSLEKGEATRVLSTMGALIPITSFVTAYIFLDERLESLAVVGFVFLIVATIVLTINPSKKKKSQNKAWITNTIIAALILGTQSIIAKYVFDNYHFISAFALTGVGAGVYVAIISLLSKNVRNEIAAALGKKTKSKKKTKRSNQVSFIFANSILGGVAVILLNYAISLGSPTLVNALRGVQYAGIFAIALLLANKYPKLLDEDLSAKSIRLKLSGIVLIIIGVILLAASS